MDREPDEQPPSQPPEPPQDVPPFEPDFDLIGKHERAPKPDGRQEGVFLTRTAASKEGQMKDLSWREWSEPATKGDLAVLEARLESQRLNRLLNAFLALLWVAAIGLWIAVLALGM